MGGSGPGLLKRNFYIPSSLGSHEGISRIKYIQNSAGRIIEIQGVSGRKYDESGLSQQNGMTASYPRFFYNFKPLGLSR